jgi:predicted component of type VI protein secretion system
MFLERKFMSPTEHRAAIEAGARPGLPAAVQDVVHNLERLLAAERGVGHVLPDYGLSRSGHWSLEGVLAHTSAQLRETLPRYETRLTLDDIETDVDDAGCPQILVLGRIGGARVTLAIDPLRRCVRAVHLG